MKHWLNLFFSLVICCSAHAQSNAFDEDIINYSTLLRLPSLAIGVAKGDSLIFFRGIGIDNPETKKPITSNHIFPIASLTKTFTAVSMKQMEVEGLLSLNDLLNKYPNEFFNVNRWDSTTTLAHILSHTSEGLPHGSNFVYNGSKFNLVFNVFRKLNNAGDSRNVTRSFTEEIERRIITPSGMNHTLLSYSDSLHSELKKWIVTTYKLNDSIGSFTAVPSGVTNMQSGPAFGMRSSVNDLVKYSSALSKANIISGEQYRELTKPYYEGSPQGLGWFTTSIDGIDIDWAYGYGSTDAALLLRVPSKGLTLIMLSACNLPSASTRLGYGNPFNSMLVCSFVRNYVLEELQKPSLIAGEEKKIRKELKELTKKTKSRIYIEEAFAMASVLMYLPETFKVNRNQADVILRALRKEYPNDLIWENTAAFELVSNSEDKELLKFGLDMAEKYANSGKIHPAKSWFSGVIYKKLGKTSRAYEILEKLAQGDQYREQVWKFDAMMELARFYMVSDPDRARDLLQRVIKHKEFISVEDKTTVEARSLLNGLK